LSRTAEKAETLSAAQVSANRQEGEAPRARDRDIQAIARKKKREIARHVLAAGSCDKKKPRMPPGNPARNRRNRAL